MLVLKRLAALAAVVVAGLAMGGAAYAAIQGQPAPWEMTFQEAATPVMENITRFHNILLWIITAITLFVLALLIIIIVRFNAKANPIPSRTTRTDDPRELTTRTGTVAIDSPWRSASATISWGGSVARTATPRVPYSPAGYS